MLGALQVAAYGMELRVWRMLLRRSAIQAAKVQRSADEAQP